MSALFAFGTTWECELMVSYYITFSSSTIVPITPSTSEAGRILTDFDDVSPRESEVDGVHQKRMGRAS
ncbi:hypothetical protein Y032_0010g1075 [Ancylostoma ceylanicum]|uniref:Uncharacterized protein n=1 Tax=Ancylostoma ceylanicum TaxID=53326 RepID=A0A016VHP5_9BILA|nr:hypothetical protein Y032_0010g1075 [Ancylostoma ceylanicum]